MVHPLFGLFAEPASTVIVSAEPSQIGAIEELADQFGFHSARIGTTGGDRLNISVYGDAFISAPLEEIRKPWAESLEAIPPRRGIGMSRVLFQGSRHGGHLARQRTVDH